MKGIVLREMEAYIPMLAILLLLVVGIGVAFLISKKYYRLSFEKARRIEILGYYLLFVVLVWELLLKNVIMEGFYNADLFYIDQRLEYLFLALKAVKNDGGTISTAIEQGFWESETSRFVHGQLIFTNLIEAALKISSTICIAVGRFYELKKVKE